MHRRTVDVSTHVDHRQLQRLIRIVAFTLMALAALRAKSHQPAPAKAPLNILLITADDLGLQLGCYGDELALTPHLDELAQKSVQFRTAYVSQASCSPSRSTMFTGLYPHGNGHYGLANAGVGFRLHEHLLDQLLPNVLHRHGYRTGIIGKLHVNPEDQFEFDERYREGFGSRDVRQQIGFARDFISKSADGPWFLMFNLFDPHVARDRLPDGSRGPQYFPNVVRGLPKETIQPSDVPPWPWQQIDTPSQLEKISGYYNCVRRIDAAIGMLWETLQDSGQADQTLIFFLGDHGPPFARGKTSCYEAGLRVPFLVRWPGVSEPHLSSRLVGSIDIYPTALDAAGIKLPDGLHGRSLRPTLTLQSQDQTNWRNTLVAEFHFHGASPFFPRRAITDGRYKLIHNLRAGEAIAPHGIDGDQAYQFSRELSPEDPRRLAMDRLADPPKWELYDLKNDPYEFKNRAGDPNLHEPESRLKQSLSDWQNQTRDPFADPGFLREVEEKYRR